MSEQRETPAEALTLDETWVCAFVACGQPVGSPHVTGCPYADHCARVEEKP